MPSIKIAIPLQKPLFDQVEALAEKMNVPRSRLFALAVEEFLRRHQSQRLLQHQRSTCGCSRPSRSCASTPHASAASPDGRRRLVIHQGDIFGIDLDDPSGSEPAYRHPHVVIQNSLFNRSRINTVVLCALTSNLQRASAPGNILLKPKEANLPKQSVVNVSQIFTVDKTQLKEKIGTLSARRVREILNGIRLLTEPREPE